MRRVNWLGTGFVRFLGLLYVVLLEVPLQRLVPGNASTASSLKRVAVSLQWYIFLYNQFKELELLDIVIKQGVKASFTL